MIDSAAAQNEIIRPRLLFLRQWFEPEQSFKGLLFAVSLAESGMDVEVVTGFPNYPGGKLYDGYRIRPIQRERMDGIAVSRVALYPSHDRSAIRRIANYTSFACSAFIYLTFFAKRADILYAYHPPMTVGLAAAANKALRGVPFVLDVQDMWPDTLRATGMMNSQLALRLVGAACAWVYRKADVIVVLSPGFKELLISRGVDEKKIRLIYNWADERAVATQQSTALLPFRDDASFKILFAGNMGPAQALVSVLDAVHLVNQRGKNISFYFLGSGVDFYLLKKYAATKELKNVTFLPAVPMNEVGAYLARADCLLVHLKNDPLFRITVPSKTQAYMAAGKPILMAVEGDAAELVNAANCGLTVPPENPQALPDAVLEMATCEPSRRQMMGLNAHRFYTENLSRRVGISAFVEIFRELAAKKHADRNLAE